MTDNWMGIGDRTRVPLPVRFGFVVAAWGLTFCWFTAQKGRKEHRNFNNLRSISLKIGWGLSGKVRRGGSSWFGRSQDS